MKRATLIQFDIETLSLHPTNAVVAEVGVHVLHLHKFRDNHGVYIGATDKLAVRLDMEEQLRSGRQVDVGTVQWWLKQDDAARNAMADSTNRVKVLDAVITIDRFVREHIMQAEHDNSNVYVLSSAINFDLPNIKALYEQVGMEQPWTHWQEHSQRTLRGLTVASKILERDKGSTAHCAADDAEYQNKVLLHIMTQADSASEALCQFFQLA